MAIQNINIGTLPNDGTGDPLRTAFEKINQMFEELYNIVEPTTTTTTTIEPTTTTSTTTELVTTTTTTTS